MTAGDWIGLAAYIWLVFICLRLVIADFKYRKAKAKYERDRNR